jgi:hypothetical protein
MTGKIRYVVEGSKLHFLMYGKKVIWRKCLCNDHKLCKQPILKYNIFLLLLYHHHKRKSLIIYISVCFRWKWLSSEFQRHLLHSRSRGNLKPYVFFVCSFPSDLFSGFILFPSPSAEDIAEVRSTGTNFCKYFPFFWKLWLASHFYRKSELSTTCFTTGKQQ